METGVEEGDAIVEEDWGHQRRVGRGMLSSRKAGDLSERVEDVVRQGYLRHAEDRVLPRVERRGRWEGRDRSRTPVEIDVVTRLLDGRMTAWSLDDLL